MLQRNVADSTAEGNPNTLFRAAELETRLAKRHRGKHSFLSRIVTRCYCRLICITTFVGKKLQLMLDSPNSADEIEPCRAISFKKKKLASFLSGTSISSCCFWQKYL